MGSRLAGVALAAVALVLTSCAPSPQARAREELRRANAVCAQVAELDARVRCYVRAAGAYQASLR
jgi:hypothetical protein